MSLETTKPSKTKFRCPKLGHMSGMYTDMMKMMEKCCPGMIEKFSNDKSVQAMMDNCCGPTVNQEKTATSPEN